MPECLPQDALVQPLQDLGGVVLGAYRQTEQSKQRHDCLVDPVCLCTTPYESEEPLQQQDYCALLR